MQFALHYTWQAAHHCLCFQRHMPTSEHTASINFVAVVLIQLPLQLWCYDFRDLQASMPLPLEGWILSWMTRQGLLMQMLLLPDQVSHSLATPCTHALTESGVRSLPHSPSAHPLPHSLCGSSAAFTDSAARQRSVRESTTGPNLAQSMLSEQTFQVVAFAASDLHGALSNAVLCMPSRMHALGKAFICRPVGQCCT